MLLVVGSGNAGAGNAAHFHGHADGWPSFARHAMLQCHGKTLGCSTPVVRQGSTPPSTSPFKICQQPSSWRHACLQVITQTIQVDLQNATTEANRVEMLLRQERLKLIKEKIKASDSSANVSQVQGGNNKLTFHPTYMLDTYWYVWVSCDIEASFQKMIWAKKP